MRQYARKVNTAVLTFLTLAVGGGVASAAEWGNLKGKVVWAGGPIKQGVIKVDKDQGHCLSKGAIPDEKFAVNPKNNGVRWVFVWLIDSTNPKKKLPIHPALAKVKGTKVVIDQPVCRFEPHALGIREGQILEAKNSSPVTHNINIIGLQDNPNINVTIPPGKSVDVEPWKASRFVVPVSCGIHGWMKSWIRVFDHPYFAVTDENGNFEMKNVPAGKFNLVAWQDEAGFVGPKTGIPIEIKGKETTEVAPIQLKP